MCGGRRTYHRLTEVPADPSPTPWNFNTWGFFCDACMTFFDLLDDGKVRTFEQDGECYGDYWHKCGARARYIGYDRFPQSNRRSPRRKRRK